MKQLNVDICIIGAGSGGLSLAAGAVQMGASVVLIEKGTMGGDCLNTGCVPSKSLLAASKVADTFRQANVFGIKSVEPDIDFKKVHDHVRDIINTIAPNDSEARFKKMGVNVIKAHGRFKDSKTVLAGNHEIKARRFVIASGSRAASPPIPGLDQVNYFTNESIFDNQEKPEHLLVIGAGPIGCEMAQAHCLLGSKVTLLDIASMLPKDEPDLVNVVRERFMQDGIVLFENIKIEHIKQTEKNILLTININGEKKTLRGSHLLIAAGRKPNVDDLGLENTNIKFQPQGITVNNRLQSISNRRVFAIGDAAGSYQFTHAANYHAGIVIRNVLFAMPAKVNYRSLPWVTYTEPELAHVGLPVKQSNKDQKVLEFNFNEIDRAITERNTQGKIKVLVNKGGLILGCSIVGHHAGELILPWCLAIQQKLKIGSMATVIAPYPTLSEISKRVAGSFYTDTLFSNKTKRIVRFIQRWMP